MSSRNSTPDKTNTNSPHPVKCGLASAIEQVSKKRAKTSAIDPFLKIAQWICRSEDPFINFPAVFHYGLQVDSSDSEDEGPDDISKWIYMLLINNVVKFDSHIDSLASTPELLEDLAKEMTKALGGAQSEDSGSLREPGLAYVAMDSSNKQLFPPIPPRVDRGSHRGFKHPMLAWLLCPIQFIMIYDENPNEVMEKLQDGRLPVSSQDLPLFLYSEVDYDDKDMELGLCRGPLLLWTWQHIFTSPSSATQSGPGMGQTKSCQAKLNNLTQVTPHTIAYAAVQAHWFMSGESDWCMEDGSFNKQEFFEAVACLFEDEPDSEWATETLDWWNSQVFLSTVSNNNQTGPPPPTGMATILAQQRAQKQKTKDLGYSSSPLHTVAPISGHHNPTPLSRQPISSHREDTTLCPVPANMPHKPTLPYRRLPGPNFQHTPDPDPSPPSRLHPCPRNFQRTMGSSVINLAVVLHCATQHSNMLKLFDGGLSPPPPSAPSSPSKVAGPSTGIIPSTKPTKPKQRRQRFF